MDVRATPSPTPVLHMYRALVGVGVACALLIVSVYELTGPIIAKNRAEALQKAIFLVVPGAASTQAYVSTDSGFDVAGPDTAGEKIYAAFDEQGALLGLAIPAAGMGYADVIEILYGYSPDKDAVVGMAVLASKETPGLGDKIAKDPVFLKNFERLEVVLDGDKPKNPIVAVKAGQKTNPWEVDGITGATISSVAIADILRESTKKWSARIEAQVSTFRAPAPEEVTP